MSSHRLQCPLDKIGHISCERHLVTSDVNAVIPVMFQIQEYDIWSQLNNVSYSRMKTLVFLSGIGPYYELSFSNVVTLSNALV